MEAGIILFPFYLFFFLQRARAGEAKEERRMTNGDGYGMFTESPEAARSSSMSHPAGVFRRAVSCVSFGNDRPCGCDAAYEKAAPGEGRL